jgi:hypothetical protein
VTETVRVLLVGVLLAGAGLGAFALRVARIDPTGPQRLIGELRLSQWMALVLAAVGGAWTGAAAMRAAVPLGTIEITLAIATMVFAAWTLHHETRQSLQLLSLGFVVHALIDISHRPGWLAADLAPRWFTVGCAAENLYLAAVCYWAQRR